MKQQQKNKMGEEQIQIGDIFLSSDKTEVTELCNLAVEIMQDSDVQKYLQLLKAKKNTGYVG